MGFERAANYTRRVMAGSVVHYASGASLCIGSFLLLPTGILLPTGNPNLRIISNSLVCVSNRLPLTLRKANGHWTTERSSGGLASAMAPMLRKTGGIWIGWSGDTEENGGDERKTILQDWARTEQCFAIELPAKIATKFYK